MGIASFFTFVFQEKLGFLKRSPDCPSIYSLDPFLPCSVPVKTDFFGLYHRAFLPSYFLLVLACGKNIPKIKGPLMSWLNPQPKVFTPIRRFLSTQASLPLRFQYLFFMPLKPLGLEMAKGNDQLVVYSFHTNTCGFPTSYTFVHIPLFCLSGPPVLFWDPDKHPKIYKLYNALLLSQPCWLVVSNSLWTHGL